MVDAWKQLGLALDHNKPACEIELEGSGGKLPQQQAEIFSANSGTTIRFLTAALSACEGHFKLDGVARMRQRPIADLLVALRQLGADVISLNESDDRCPPVEIRSKGLRGGTAKVAGNISSQFLSALMMAAPMASGPVTLVVEGELVSLPYVEMTAAVMREFGATVSGSGSGPFVIDGSIGYRGTDYAIEPDASAASYFWAAAAITGGQATVEGLNRNALQGDVKFCEVLQQMGCSVNYRDQEVEVLGGSELKGVDVDMSQISDTVQTLAAVAMFAKGPTTVRGVAHNRVKETDRISDLARELMKLGAKVDEFEDGLRIHPPESIQPGEIDTYHDHRMAMSLALVGLRQSGIIIRDPDCTSKTYPNYWQDLAKFSGSRIDVSGS
jgi:3-phosphoshikimate 1-carboxyvinyltransferase